MRKRLKRRKDKRIFTRTASLTHKKNISSQPQRGGVMLWEHAEDLKEEKERGIKKCLILFLI